MRAKMDRKPGFDSEFDGITLKIKLRGEIDHHSAGAVRVSMDDMIKAKRPQRLMMDMSAVDFMDSSGLGLIMGRYSLMESIGGEAMVVDPSPATERIMSLAGMERMIKIVRTCATVDSATAQLSSKASAEREIKRRRSHHRRAGERASMSRGEGISSIKENEVK